MLKKYVYSFYMIGNHDLASYVQRDLYKKLGGHYTRGSNSNIDVVCYSSYYYRNKLHNYIYYGGAKRKNPFEYKIKKNIMPLDNYLSFVKKNFFAQYYVINLWGHGYGWQYTLPFFNQCLNMTKNIELDELKYSLSRNKFDILVFETCAGMSLESIYELRNEVKYICGNCDYTGYEGINHKEIIKCNDQPEQFCKAIVDYMNKELCPSFIKTKKGSFIKKKIKIISKILLKVKNKDLIFELKKNLKKNIIDDCSIDLGYLLCYIIHNTQSKRLKHECMVLYKYLKKNIYCVPKKRFRINKCCGIHIYFPRKHGEFSLMREKYKVLSFNKNNKWIEILDILNKK
jgi:hypothetical protein